MTKIKDLIEKRQTENFSLHQFINPQFAKVLATIGFNRNFKRAEGMSLFDIEGNEYYDFLSGYGVFAYGRNHKRLKEEINAFLEMNLSNLVQMDAPILCGLLAEKLIDLFGHDIRDTVFFTNSGTEANEAAIKFARCATKREKILHLEHGFHGLTLGSLSVNGNSEFRDGFGTLLSSEAVPLNDLNALEDKLKTKEFAAFIFEPIQGKGVYVPEQDYLKNAMLLCHKYGTLTIADEVQSGIGRTGKWLASEHFEIEPDFVTLAKALSGGMVQTGAVVYRHDIYKKVFSRMDRCVVHSSTFGKNNLSMVCGLTSLDIIEEENLLQCAQDMGEYFLTQLHELKAKHDWIKDVRGKGLMIGIEFGKPKGMKKRFIWDTVHSMDKGLFGELIVMPLYAQYRILTQVSGHHQDIVKLIPPLIINKDHIDYFTKSLDQVLTEAENITGPIMKMGKNLAKHIMRKRA